MQLKRIQLTGFKSFVDVTQIPVLDRMSAVVGPNGCGKSNIVDAIRWVSGEMSAKQLRGQSMSDVIFNGSANRKPAGKAAVELVFDNADGRISGEYAGFSEIAIRREVVRDAQSDYFINGVPARRRDLVDLFLGTGLGPRSYAIIEQGMITQLIEAKPEELRSHLEEVAGISKYRERRRETENRIRHTQENLDRLNDIREELAKQLRHLKRQANAAEKYQTLKQEQRLIHAQIKALQWQAFHVHSTEKNKQIEEQSLLAEAQLTKQRDAEKNIETLRFQTQTLLDEKNGIQKNFYHFSSEIARLEQHIQHKQEQIKQWKKELIESESLFQELRGNADTQTKQIQELTEMISQWQPQSATLQSDLDHANQVLQRAETRMQQAEIQWDQFQDQLLKINSALEVAKNNMQHDETQIFVNQEKHAQFKKQLSELSNHILSFHIQPLSEKAATLKESLALLNDSLSDLSQQILQKRAAFEEKQIQFSHAQGELQKLEAQYASLHALQQNVLSNQPSVSNWIQQNAFNHHSRLGKTIQVESGWETAVETVLGSFFDAICVDEQGDLVTACRALPEGQVTLLSATRTDKKQASLKTILSVIHENHHLPAFLNQIYIANDLQDALQKQADLNATESIVTKTGMWIGSNWIRIGRGLSSKDSFLMREKTLKNLKEEIEIQKKALQEKEQDLAFTRNQLSTLESTRDAQHQGYQTTSVNLTETQTALNEQQSQWNELNQQQKHFSEEIKRLEWCIQQDEHHLKETQSTIAEYTALQGDQLIEKEKLSKEKINATTELTTARNDAHAKKQRLDEWSIRFTASENQLHVLTQTLTSNQKQLVQLTERRTNLQAQLNESHAPVQVWSSELQQALHQRADIESALQTAEQQFESHQHQLKTWESERDALMKAIASLQEKQQALRMEHQEMLVRQTTLVEQLSENHFDLNELLRELPNEANLTEWELRSNQIQTSVDRLGPINLAAIDEHQSISERKNYLDQQYQDLTEALEVLQNAIRKIDRETRQLFQNTYEQVNQCFQKLFPQVFGGGQASLTLTEDNLLTTGIIVRAQPPGKRNTTIHMLSGGEKTLTAIALMFSMFQLNPAPFCVLDEVDAALDDLNVGRFCHLVKEMSNSIQFLVISHNKTTIQAADHLMGVTMQEPGVSRIVSVDIQAAVEMAEA